MASIRNPDTRLLPPMLSTVRKDSNRRVMHLRHHRVMHLRHHRVMHLRHRATLSTGTTVSNPSQNLKRTPLRRSYRATKTPDDVNHALA